MARSDYLRPYVVADISYRCRDLGSGIEAGRFEGYIAGSNADGRIEVHAIGGHTGLAGIVSLYADELVSIDYADERVTA